MTSSLTSILDGVLPVDLHLPSKFTEFRLIQQQLADCGLYGPGGGSNNDQRRFIAMGASTGSGKTIAAQAIGKLCGMKYVVLTATRSLEDQIVNDGFNTVNVRGRANYLCLGDVGRDHKDRRWTCQDGEENECPHYGKPTCTYDGKRVEAGLKDSIVTNYQYWMHARARNRGALESEHSGPIGLLICDEAHQIANVLSNFLGTWVSDQDLHRWANTEIRECVRAGEGAEWGRVNVAWISALGAAVARITARMSNLAADYRSEAEAARRDKDYRKLAKLSDSLERVLEHGGDGNWIWRTTRAGIAFDCVWPGRYAERYLWSGVEKVVLMSATLRPKTLTMAGLRPSDYHYKEFPAVFRPQDSPVYWVPTGKMGHKESEETKLLAVAKIDEMFEEWQGYPGIIHSVSYDRAEWIKRNSRYTNYMILSKPGEAGIAAEKYKLRTPPVMLVTPSHATGWDFDTHDISWSMIIKLPFPDRSDPVVLARAESDGEWYDYETMQTLVQACGRQKRRTGQRTVTIVTDDAIRSFRQRAARFAPKWWRCLDAPGGKIPGAPR